MLDENCSRRHFEMFSSFFFQKIGDKVLYLVVFGVV